MKIIDSGLKFLSNIKYGNKPDKIVLHHAASTSCSIKDVHYWHLKKGWAGCGYHFFIRKEGSVYRGRDVNVIGAHCKGYNTGSIGICLEGNYMVESMPEAQKEAVIELCKELVNKYSIKHIYGHKKFVKTACPGVKFPLEEIIDKVFYESKAIAPYPGYSLKRIKPKHNKNVVRIQKRLMELGYNVGESGVDRYFGRETEKAVKQFQGNVGIRVDGIVGKVTWEKLFKNQ